MLNKLTLSFKSDAIEQEFRDNQSIKVKEEFNLFTIQCLLFFPFYLSSYFQSEYFNLTSILIIFIIAGLIIVFKLIIDSCPKYAIIILPALQIIFAIVWSIDNLQSSLQVSQYQWFYGFQSFYFHSAIMQQGYQILPQAISILGLYILFLILYMENSLEFIALSLTQLSVLLGLIFLKYTNLKLKRLQFIDNRERNKWIKIIEQIVDYELIVVEFDKRQDQIIIKQINERTKKKFQIQDNQELRKILRDMAIIHSGSSHAKLKTESLEMAIREQFCCNFEQLIPSYDVSSSILKQEFRVKLIQYILQDVQCVILAFDSQSRQEIKQTLSNQKLQESLFIQCSSKILSSICTFNNKLLVLQQIVNLQFYRIWLDNKHLLLTQRSQFKMPEVIQQLQNTLSRQIIFKNIPEFNDSFQLNLRALQMVLVGLTQFVDSDFQVMIKWSNKILFSHLTFKMETKKVLFSSQVYNLIKRQLDFDDKNWIKNKQKILECIQILSEKRKISQEPFLFTLIMCEYVLYSAFNQSTLRLQTKKDKRLKVSFEILI
ncbi:unnamed protein product (macronuclear) [Paramecium tetraurelia]|uniref:Transmembrane protein n=1 Tax=Paramecium tetraurelia TaxID=5888 RepID=A0CWY6_PARTE|nr:uncharacterized protein GSPATT00001506001 [Paramecium tetraurelia]CAK75303.1 unnamed protein product [Paramecium tetraurelia]|eukprot:XP_001442700.1 hypothetical protein (macronuclear) [Paramecium tetraurelia strain d4-2]